MGGVEGRFSYLKICLQAVPASLFSEKDYTLLSIELFFGEKVLKIFWILFNSILRLRLPEYGKSYLKSNFSNDYWNTPS